jgi:hypothetical protein
MNGYDYGMQYEWCPIHPHGLERASMADLIGALTECHGMKVYRWERSQHDTYVEQVEEEIAYRLDLGVELLT